MKTIDGFHPYPEGGPFRTWRGGETLEDRNKLVNTGGRCVGIKGIDKEGWRELRL